MTVPEGYYHSPKLSLISPLGKAGPGPKNLLWGGTAADRRRGSQSPCSLWDGLALPTSSAWLEKVVCEALGHGNAGKGEAPGLIHQARLASQTGIQAKPKDDLASF